MRVSVNLRADVARGIVEPAAADDTAQRVLEVVGNAGASLEPTHGGTPDPDLQRWFGVEVPDEATATELSAALLAIDGVDAAYVEPPAAPA